MIINHYSQTESTNPASSRLLWRDPLLAECAEPADRRTAAAGGHGQVGLQPFAPRPNGKPCSLGGGKTGSNWHKWWLITGYNWYT